MYLPVNGRATERKKCIQSILDPFTYGAYSATLPMRPIGRMCYVMRKYGLPWCSNTIGRGPRRRALFALQFRLSISSLQQLCSVLRGILFFHTNVNRKERSSFCHLPAPTTTATSSHGLESRMVISTTILYSLFFLDSDSKFSCV